MQHIGPDDVDKLGMMFAKPSAGEQQVLEGYKDPMSHFKTVEKVIVKHDDINDRLTLKSQYQAQVFQPSHNLPTMSIEQLAEQEYEDAMRRQHEQQVSE